MKLYVKNMVCPRCVMSVEQLLNEQQIPFKFVRLGEVETDEVLSKSELKRLDKGLGRLGFELLNDPSSRLIEQVKGLLIQQIQTGIEDHFSIRKFLKTRVFKNYSSISKLFSAVEGITIEQFFIIQRIEKAKELLIYDEMTLSGIAAFLGYSSSQHLSSQFKKVTGMTPTKLKESGTGERRFIGGTAIRDGQKG